MSNWQDDPLFIAFDELGWKFDEIKGLEDQVQGVIADRKDVVVNLAKEEMLYGGMAGLLKRVSSEFKKDKNMKSIDTAKLWAIDMDSANAEKAVAKYLDVYFPGRVDTYKREADVGIVEVRQTHLDYGRLILRPPSEERKGDNPEAPFVLVTGSQKTFRICGWIIAQDGMLDHNRKNPNNKGEAWWVPQQDLRYISELKRKIHEGWLQSAD